MQASPTHSTLAHAFSCAGAREGSCWLLSFSDGINKGSPPGTAARGLGTQDMKCLHCVQLPQGFPRTKLHESKDQTEAAKGIKELGDD